eukprot:2006475-Pyramimonas_sp.AAC.1
MNPDATLGFAPHAPNGADRLRRGGPGPAKAAAWQAPSPRAKPLSEPSLSPACGDFEPGGLSPGFHLEVRSRVL